MIGKASKSLRGTSVRRLLYYLYGPGKATEHTNPRVVAAWIDPAGNGLEPRVVGRRSDGWPMRDFTRLVALMEQPLLIAGDRAPAKPVWHCILRNHDDDRILSDAEWGQIAHEVIRRMGFDDTSEHLGVPWVAVRHDKDGIHLAAVLAREDGTIPSLWRDYYRIRAACNWAEQAYGLTVTTNPGDRTAAKRATRAETEKAERRGRAEPARDTLRRLVRQAAVAARNEAEFAAELHNAGVVFEPRESVRNPGQITGYKVALPGDTTAEDMPVWYSGRTLAADLTWPHLTARWSRDGAAAGGDLPMSGQERARTAYCRATRAAGVVADYLTAEDRFDPDAVDDLAAGADAVLIALDLARPGRAQAEIRAAANAFERAGRRSRPGPACGILGATLRQAAWQLIQASRSDRGDTTDAWLALAAELSRLAGLIARARLAQGRREQAVAAYQAAAALHTLSEQHNRPSTAALAGIPPIDPTRGHYSDGATSQQPSTAPTTKRTRRAGR